MAQAQQRYRVIEKIAAGGMAEVYRAESAGLEGFKKTVAIKRVLPHLSQKKEFIGMFLDEARLSAHLSHSNVVQVFDIGVGDDTYFIVMEYVDGANLKAVIEHRKSLGRPIGIETAALIGLRICEGLSYAHEARDPLGQALGIVHRDVSPPNVLISKHGEVKVVDFGLAKANSQLEASQPGIIKGKFSYLSPEAALGQTVDQRTDIFAAGIILWEMLTGERLFLGETDLGTVRQVQAAQVPPLSKYLVDCPPGLQQVVDRALARDPKDRYQAARDFGRDLNRILFQVGRPVSSFDLSGLVGEVVTHSRIEPGARPKQQTLIGSLIQDAMMSFTSLQHQNRDKSNSASGDAESGVGAAPLSFSFGPGGSIGHARSKYPSQVSFKAVPTTATPTKEPSGDEPRKDLSSMLQSDAAEETSPDELVTFDRSVLATGRTTSTARRPAEPAPPSPPQARAPAAALQGRVTQPIVLLQARANTGLPRAFWILLLAFVALAVLVAFYLATRYDA